ncbi:MAG: ABC transporter permease, partial [Anaerolineales bacterium]|nr:ABC transporter permease [Anaerolineales bacterium]
MKHLLQQVFQSGKFVTGFVIFVGILLIVIIYPLFVPNPPLEIIGQGTFFEPGIYVNVYDSLSSPTYTLNLDEAAARRIASKLGDDDRVAIQEWLVGAGMSEAEIDITNTEQLLDQWFSNFDPSVRLPGMTNADRNY